MDAPTTVANVEILKQRGSTFIGPVKGMLACDYEGIGVSGRSTTSSPKRLHTTSADVPHARQRKKKEERSISSYSSKRLI